MEFDFNEIIDRKHTNAIKYDLAKARNKPEDAISLWVADMDFAVGVSIVKHAAKYHDASILLNSEVGKGRTFTVVF